MPGGTSPNVRFVVQNGITQKQAARISELTGGNPSRLLAGGLTLADYGGLANRAVQSYGPLVSSVARITDDLLRQCGARLPALETRMIRLLPLREK